MPRLAIRFLPGSSTPSVLVDGDFGGPIVREFIADELRPASICTDFLRKLEAVSSGQEFDFGFWDAIAVHVRDGVAHLEHVVPDIPQYQLPASQLVEMVRAWSVALASKPSAFTAREFDIPA